MSQDFSPDRLDVKAFALAGGRLTGRDPLSLYGRLQDEAVALSDALHVAWTAEASMRTLPGGATQPWLRLQAQATLPLECQRCLTPADTLLEVDREFRFVPDEATAEAEDEDSEEDLLVLSRDFDLRELIEDELLLALPLVPMHEVCPEGPVLSAQSETFEQAQAERPHPFAALAALRKPG